MHRERKLDDNQEKKKDGRQRQQTTPINRCRPTLSVAARSFRRSEGLSAHARSCLRSAGGREAEDDEDEATEQVEEDEESERCLIVFPFSPPPPALPLALPALRVRE